MCVFIGLFLILLSVILYQLTRRISDPMVIVTSSWGISLFMYGAVDHGMPPLSSKVSFIFLLWTFCLLLGIIAFNYHKSKRFINKEKIKHFDDLHDIEKNTVLKKNLNVFYWISIICFFPQLYISYMQAISGGGNIFINMIKYLEH